MSGWVYILTSRPRGTLYVGVTNNLVRRIHEHREGLADGFTKSQELKKLVFYERHETMPLAIQRDRTIKHWPRRWQIDLVVGMNSEWVDL